MPREPYRDVELIYLDRLYYPLGLITALKKHRVPRGHYAWVTLTAANEHNVRDYYLRLTDDRECEVQLRSSGGADQITVPVDLVVAPNEDWSFDVFLDLTSNRIDPAECATGYVLHATVDRYEVAQYTPP